MEQEPEGSGATGGVGGPGIAETVSIADSDAQRSVSPLRVRKQRDEVQFNIKAMVFKEKRFSDKTQQSCLVGKCFLDLI